MQTVDSPTPVVNGNFGLAMVNAGDIDRDGKDDLLVGTDEHGGSVSPVYLLSGATGAVIRTLTAPDPGGSGSEAGFGSYVGKLADIGSCPGGTPSMTCPNATIGAADGVPEQLVTALGVDVGGLVDAGRAYVLDGATGAVLKRLDMPTSDIADQVGTAGGKPANVKPAFGRTILNPASAFGATKADLSGPSPASAGVQIGDLNGGGKPDIAVGASDYYETSATANPASPCAANLGSQCLQAGREYIFDGESIAGSNPAVIDNTPYLTIKNPTAQPDDLNTSVNGNRESMGYSVAPVGDVGSCGAATPGPGAACTVAQSTTTPDGRPEIALSSHRTDEFGMFDVGVVLLVDGATGSVLVTYHHPEPQPASLFGFSNYNQPAVGDLGNSVAPDVYEAAMRQNNPYTGGGRGYAMNGNFRQTGSPNSISFASFADPTPTPSGDFGTSSAGIGDVAGDGRTEVMIGAYGPHNPGTNADAINDVSIFSALTEQPLQTIQAPDQQPGAGFGTALAPLGDLNGDGFQDYAIGAGLYDGTGATPRADQGRIYIMRSDNSPAPPAPAPPANPGPAGPSGPAGPAAPPAVVRAGRVLDLVATRPVIRRGRRELLRGSLDAFANPSGCRSGQTVTIQRRSATGGLFLKIGTARTSAAGSFSFRTTVRSSSAFRARVPQTAGCLGAASAAERVLALRR